jgi:vacuolar-type H+-ATPase subunit E/Vma4
MALGDIKHDIDEQAKNEAGGIRKSASSEAEAIIGDARARAKGVLQSIERQIEEELKRLRDESEASTELAAKNITLTAREEALAEEAAKIRRLLVKDVRSSQSYGKIFRNATKQAMELAPQGELVISVDRLDRSKLGNTTSKVDVKDLGGGLIIRSKNGDVEIDATLGKLIDSKSDEIRGALLAEMFGSEKRQKPIAERAPKKTVLKAKAKKPAKAAKAKAKPKKKSKR